MENPTQNLSLTVRIDRTPEEVFAAILDPRRWWAGDIDGPTDQLGGEFTYAFQQLHRSTQRVTTLDPGRRVVWHVVDGYLAFVADTTEWSGTDITFDLVPADGGTELSFTHVGLSPESECFDTCSAAWGHYVGQSLRQLLENDAHSPGNRSVPTPPVS